MRRSIQPVTPEVLESALGYVAAWRNRLARRSVARAVNTVTPGRHYQRSLAAGRDAILEALVDGGFVANAQAATRAIRKGCGPDFDFTTLNRKGAIALGLLEDK